MSFSQLSSVFESFYDFFFILSLIYFPLEYTKTKKSEGFACIEVGKTSKFKLRKNQ
jgi:hypothetical protein